MSTLTRQLARVAVATLLAITLAGCGGSATDETVKAFGGNWFSDLPGGSMTLDFTTMRYSNNSDGDTFDLPFTVESQTPTVITLKVNNNPSPMTIQLTSNTTITIPPASFTPDAPPLTFHR